MKKIFGLVLSAFLALQAMTVSAVAPDDAVIAEDAAIETEADATVTFTDVMCNPGEEIAVEILFDSAVPVNSIALHNLTYDMERLEFLGFAEEGDLLSQSFFGAQGIDRNLNTVVLGMMTSKAYSGKICSLMFRVKEEAGYGMSEVTMTTVVKNNSDDIATAVDTALVAAGHVEFTIGESFGGAGDVVAIPISINTDVPVNSIALSELVYDTDALTFVGFSDYSELVTDSLFGVGGIDEEKQVITIGLKNSQPVYGDLCSILFRVNEDAEVGVNEIRMTSIVKDYSDEIYSTVESGAVVIGDVSMALDAVMGMPGDTVSVDVMVTESTVPVDSLDFCNLSYDTEKLTFVGYSMDGYFLTEEEFVSIPFTVEGAYLEGAVVTLNFVINENAASGAVEIGLDYFFGVPGGNYSYGFAAESGVVAIGKTDVYVGSASGAAGNVVAVDIFLDSTVAVDTVGVYHLMFDTDLLTFVGFGDYEGFAAKCISSDFSATGLLPSFTFTFAEPELLSDVYVCKAYFTINEGAADGVVAVGFGGLQVSCDDVYFCTEAFSGSVEIQNRELGDISGDGAVDINDALALFRHIMMPSIYGIDYPGAIDLTKDGAVDIRDALRLFQFSMMPGLYPIEW